MPADVSIGLAAMRSDYNRHSQGQLQLFDMTKPYIEMAVDAHSAWLPCFSEKSAHELPMIEIADFGSSTGANSSTAMSYIIERLRSKYGPERALPIRVVHVDVPRNDWTELFKYVYLDGASYLNKHKSVFAAGAGFSFYKQVLPDRCLHFGYSSCALHWLSQVPVKIANHCMACRASPEERQLFRRQAACDWRDFLTARSKELVPGGVLVANIMGQNNDDGISMMNKLADALYEAVLRLERDGQLTSEERLNFNLGVEYRSMADVNDRELLSSLGLEVVAADSIEKTPSTFHGAFKKHGEMEQLAQDHCDMMMAVIEPAFREVFAKWRTADDQKSICSKLAKNYTEALAKLEPDAFSFTMDSILLVLKKKQ